MKLLGWLLALVIAVLTVASFWVPPAKEFPAPELARLIFFQPGQSIGSGEPILSKPDHR